MPLIQNEINNLFLEFKIISTQKEIVNLKYVLFCEFSLIIKIMETFFNEYLKINIFEPNDFNQLDLENPNARKLFEVICQKVYHEIFINNLFRCESCYNIILMKLNSEYNIEFKCQCCDSQNKELNDTEALKTIYTEFFCFNCEEKLILYKENYKCTSCKQLL